MEALLKLTGEIKNKFGTEELSKYKIGIILEKLVGLEDKLELLKSKKSNIRFKDYINFNEEYEVNFEYFSSYYSDDDSLLCFSMYYLSKELLDVLEALNDEIFKIEEIDYMYSASYFDSISNIIDDVSQSLSKGNVSLEIQGNAQIINLAIFSDNIDEARKLSSESKSGMGEASIKRSMSSILTLLGTSYDNPQFSRFVHKIKTGKSKDLRLTSNNILGERYSAGKTTKVAFFKLPIIPSNLEMIKKELNVPNLEYIYFIPGFGNFNEIGISEGDLYEKFISFSYQCEPFFQKLVDMVSVPFKPKDLEEFIQYINDFSKEFNDMCKFNNGREK